MKMNRYSREEKRPDRIRLTKTIQGRWGDSSPSNFPRLWTGIQWPKPRRQIRYIGGNVYAVYHANPLPVRREDYRFYFMGEKQ